MYMSIKINIMLLKLSEFYSLIRSKSSSLRYKSFVTRVSTSQWEFSITFDWLGVTQVSGTNYGARLSRTDVIVDYLRHSLKIIPS